MFSLKYNETPWRRRCKPQSNLLYTILINLIGFPQEENKRKDQSVELGDYKEKPLGKVKDQKEKIFTKKYQKSQRKSFFCIFTTNKNKNLLRRQSCKRKRKIIFLKSRHIKQGAETSCLCVCTKRVCVCNKELNSCTVSVYNT